MCIVLNVTERLSRRQIPELFTKNTELRMVYIRKRHTNDNQSMPLAAPKNEPFKTASL